MGDYRRVDLGSLPLDSEKNLLVDLYIHLPTLGRYIRFMAAGDRLDDVRLQRLQSHPDPHLYVAGPLDRNSPASAVGTVSGQTLPSSRSQELESSLSSRRSSARNPELTLREKELLADSAEFKERIPEPKEPEIEAVKVQSFSGRVSEEDAQAQFARDSASIDEASGGRHSHKHGIESYSGTRKTISAGQKADPSERMGHISAADEKHLREGIREQLIDVYQDILSDKESVQSVGIEKLENKASQLLNAIAPDIETLRHHLKMNSKYLNIMNDTASIISLAVLFASAASITARNIFKDIAYACVVMDLPLSDLPQEDQDLYYKDRTQLPAETLKRIHQHPWTAYRLLQKKMRGASEFLSQLVLSHHELYNGKGYPRKIRSEMLSPAIRMVALAVDTFEILKSQSLKGQPVTLLAALSALKEDGVDGHLKRHNKKLVDTVYKFLIDEDAEGVNPFGIEKARS